MSLPAEHSAALIVFLPLQGTVSDDIVQYGSVKMRTFSAAFPLCCQQGPDAIHLKIIVCAVGRVGDKEFAAAVFPHRTVVFKGPGPQVQSPDMVMYEKMGQASRRGDMHGRAVRPFFAVVTCTEGQYGHSPGQLTESTEAFAPCSSMDISLSSGVMASSPPMNGTFKIFMVIYVLFKSVVFCFPIQVFRAPESRHRFFLRHSRAISSLPPSLSSSP